MEKLKTKISGFPAYFRDWLKTFRGKLTLICLIGLILIPFGTQNPYIIGIFNTFMIYTIFAISWDFLAGYVGQVSFGHAIFLGVSGYATSYFIKYFAWPWWSALLFGAIIAVLFGLIVGVPALRLKGPYLALGTLAMSLILYQVFLMGSLGILWEDAFGTELFGTDGLGQVPPISTNITIQYFAILFIMCISVLILTYIVKSNIGTIFKAIRDDETGTSASGINTTKYKILAFLISGFFAGIAGGLYALRFSGVNPGVFQPLYSFYAIIMVAIGGIATLSGAALGAFIFVFLGEILRLLGDIPQLEVLGGFMEPIFIFSILLILIIRFSEHGLLKPILERLQNLWDVLLGR
ncbi:MAG: branched-chain amino acid ABC transporter permease [Candidatus Lokiarchaeota archaeon]|nr:branched-chain amino acid ABC transporter permease [Candidatus Lokiarchaeota archaeon]